MIRLICQVCRGENPSVGWDIAAIEYVYICNMHRNFVTRFTSRLFVHVATAVNKCDNKRQRMHIYGDRFNAQVWVCRCVHRRWWGRNAKYSMFRNAKQQGGTFVYWIIIGWKLMTMHKSITILPRAGETDRFNIEHGLRIASAFDMILIWIFNTIQRHHIWSIDVKIYINVLRSLKNSNYHLICWYIQYIYIHF